MLFGELQPAHRFVEPFIEGYRFGFRHILGSRSRLEAAEDWWHRLNEITPRYLIRPTLYYAMLVRLIQQPTFLEEPESIDPYLRTHLSHKLRNKIDLHMFIDYEMMDLRKYNIPYFYCMANQKSIFNSDDIEYAGFFDMSPINYLGENFDLFSEEYMEKSISILKRELSKDPFGSEK